MQVLVSGSSGFIGSTLKAHLGAGGHDVVALVRSEPGAGERHWRPDAGVLDPSVFDGIDGVVNLNGVGVGDKRWTTERRKLIYDSRIASTRLLADAMTSLAHPPGVFVSASGIDYYGDRGDEVLTEESGAGPSEDFLVQLTTDWEAATAPARDAGIRVVNTRSGMVLDRSGGALRRMLLPFKLGVGGRLGSGGQWWSWISLTDEVRAITHLLESDAAGPVNLTAPEPVTNANFTKTLAAVLHRPSLVPVPKIALKAILGGGVAEALAFSSKRVLPKRLTATGFTWEHPDLLVALKATLNA